MPTTHAHATHRALSIECIIVRKSYVRVVIVWLLTLAGLYAFQQYFS